ncbi:hypothetical protein MD484_g9107, partial [Candolleomyces efflorescens]
MAYLDEEIDAGRMSGRYTLEEVEKILGGPVYVSPLLVAVSTQQPGAPDKIRICRHLSKGTAAHPSVNSFIHKEEFPTRLDTALQVAEVIANAPPGTQACTLDIAKYHRTCPVNPSHKCWLVVQDPDGMFIIDHVHPFGCTCASGNTGMIGNAAVDIWRAKRVAPVLKYEDDLSVFRIPNPDGCFVDSNGYRYDYDCEEAVKRLSPLGIPWHPDKGDPVFREVYVYIGFEWDISAKTVRLPLEKRLKFLDRVRRFLFAFKGKRCTLHDIEKIHGSLCHVAFVYVDGRSHLPSLSNFGAKFGGNRATYRFLPNSALNDLIWWEQRLEDPSVTRSIRNLGPPRDIGLYIDASTSWGIGIVAGDRWAAFRLRDGWKQPGQDICFLETVAIELLTYFLDTLILDELGLHDAHLVLHSDNKGTIGAVMKGRSRNHHINYVIRRLWDTLLNRAIAPQLEFVPSAQNPADPISRGHLGHGPRPRRTTALPWY